MGMVAAVRPARLCALMHATSLWLLSQPAGRALPRLGACTAEARWVGARGVLRVERALRRGAQEDTHGPTAPSWGEEPETERWLVRQADNTDGLEAKRDGGQ